MDTGRQSQPHIVRASTREGQAISSSERSNGNLSGSSLLFLHGFLLRCFSPDRCLSVASRRKVTVIFPLTECGEVLFAGALDPRAPTNQTSRWKSGEMPPRYPHDRPSTGIGTLSGRYYSKKNALHSWRLWSIRIESRPFRSL